MIFPDDIEYANRSLAETLVMSKDNVACYILNVHNKKQVEFRNLKTEENSTESLNYFNFNHPLHLGNVNQSGEVFVVNRVPKRQYRAGLNRNNIRIKALLGHRDFQLVNKSVNNSLTNNYPNLQDCLELLDSGIVDCIAFSKIYSLLKEGKIIHIFRLNKAVGTIDKDDQFALKPEFAFLTEELSNYGEF